MGLKPGALDACACSLRKGLRIQGLGNSKGFRISKAELGLIWLPSLAHPQNLSWLDGRGIRLLHWELQFLNTGGLRDPGDMEVSECIVACHCFGDQTLDPNTIQPLNRSPKGPHCLQPPHMMWIRRRSCGSHPRLRV